ncbi:MAG: hypothetical protein S4CHLAM81_11460 [Chlamydiales bacterium]|nr:hypothetical protein [Chlamydiales bacterium]MCH9635923.1 hypothetical protein [Chlamydiales bacterium]MCH9704046.1 hypothetical protein [Chlamydiota bacterium]
MTEAVGSNTVFVQQKRALPAGAIALVTLGILAVAAGILGRIQPKGFSQIVAKHLAAPKVHYSLMAAGGATILLGLADIGFGRRGSKHFKRASLFRRVNLAVRLPIHALRSRLVRNQVIGSNKDVPKISWYRRARMSGGETSQYVAELKRGGDHIPAEITDFDHIYPAMNTNYPECGRNLIFVDLVLKGVIDHIVTLKIDRDAGEIHYYDSKGLTLNDRAGAVVRDWKKPLPQVVEELAQEYKRDKSFTIIENTRCEQFDCHSCGVMVSMKKCLWARAQEDGLSSKSEIFYRNELISHMQLPGDYQPVEVDLDAIIAMPDSDSDSDMSELE